MKIRSIVYATIVLLLLMVPCGLCAQEQTLSPAARIDLQNFIAAQRPRALTFEFWMAHPPDAHDPNMAIIWMALPGHPPKDADGVLVYVKAARRSGATCLKSFVRGTSGTITIATDASARIRGSRLFIKEFHSY